MQKIKLGIYEDLTLQLGTRQIGSVFPINAHELISTTMREIRRFEGEEIKESVQLPFSCACFISGVGFIAAHTISGSEIWIMRSSDLTHPILKNFKTGQTCVYHMIYSPKSKSIITIGSGIKVFKISWEQKGSHFFSSNFEVTITCRSEFADDYDASLLNPPSFDFDNEYILLPTPEGICSFDLDGELIKFASKLPADNNTSYSFCQKTGKLLTFDPVDGLCLWKRDGSIDKRINISSIIIIGLRFVDTENVICLSSTYSLYLLNIKTSNIFECYTSPPYTRLTRFYCSELHYKPYVFMCYGNKLTLLRINAPWKVFSLGIIRARSIHRYSKSGEAARICVFTDNSFVKLFNPKKSCLLTSATPSQPIYPFSYFYDRGLFIYYKQDTLYRKYLSNIIEIDNRDYLYLIYQNGSLCKFDANTSPAVETWTKDIRAHIMTLVWYKNTWCYAISHLHGMLSFIECDSFERIKEISFSKKAVKFMLYNYMLNCLIFITNKSIKIFDLQTELVKLKFKNELPNVAYLFGDILYLGYNDGRIIRYSITKWSLNFVEPEIMTKPHDEAVTSLDFSPNFYLSSSLDMTCIIWNYFHSKIIQLKVPFPIYSVAFHGVKRHLLIGSKDSLMMLQGNLLFGDDNWDPELIGLDSYDLLDDKLDPRLIAERNVERKKEEAIVEAETVKRFEKSIINSEKRKALQRAFEEFKKNQEELIEKFNNDSTLGVAAKTPEARQRTVDQMLQLLDLANNEEAQTKENAIKNARLFLEKDEERRKNLNEKVDEEEEEEEVKSIQKNSIKPTKFVSGADFIKNQMEIEKKNKKSRKRKSKRKRKELNMTNLNENENKNENKNDSNLLEMLNLKTQKLNKSPNKRSKVEMDISKMNFVECTTENIEEPKEILYEYYSEYQSEDEVKKKKKKKNSKGKKNANDLKKANSLSKINLSSISKKSSSIKLNEKMMATSSILQKTSKTLKKNNSKSKILKSSNSHGNVSPIKKKQKSQHNSKSNDQIDHDLSEGSQTITNTQLEDKDDNSIKIQHNEFIDINGQIQQLMNYEFVNDDGEIVELPEGQFVNKEGQIVNKDGQLIDENGNILPEGKYRYRDKYGKICVFSSPLIDDGNINKISIDDFTDCIFVDDFGNIVKNCNVYLNEYGEYIDAFGEVLTKISTHVNSEGQKCIQNGLIVSEDGQLINGNGQKVSIEGELIPEIGKIYYSDFGCQTKESIFMKRSINSRIQKIKKFFRPKNKRYRPSTPPPILWNTENKDENERPKNNSNSNSNQNSLPINNFLLHHIDSQSRAKRSRTPPQLRSKAMSNTNYIIPQQNYVLDSEAVLSIYGRGHTELLPLVFRLVREGSVSPLKVPIPSNQIEKTETPETPQNNKKSPHKKKSTSPQLRKEKQTRSKLNLISVSSKHQFEKSESPTNTKTKVNKSFSHSGSIIKYHKVFRKDTESEQNNNSETTITNKNHIKEEEETKEIQEIADDLIINDYSNGEEENFSENDLKFSSNESHHITFILPDQNDYEQQNNNKPTPPHQPHREHEVFRRQHISPQPLKPPSAHDHLNESPRRAPRRNYNSNTFMFTSSEIYEEKDEPDINSKHFKRFKKSKEESQMIKQKRKNQRKSDKSIKFQVLGVPTYQKDKKNICLPPKDHIDDHYPMALNQKGKKFETPDQFNSNEVHKQHHNSDNSDDSNAGESIVDDRNGRVSKFEATRSTRTTPKSLSMARYYDDELEEKKETYQANKNKKSIIDYSFLLELGAVEEPKVADDIIKDFEDKEDILFSLRSMFPKTNQMAMMIQTPESIRNTRYSTSLQDHSKEYIQSLHSKSIVVKKKQKKKNKNSFSFKK